MVEHDHQAHAGQPVGIRNPARERCPHAGPALRADQHALPAQRSSGTRLAVAGQHLALWHRPRELAAQRLERCLLRDGRIVEGLAQLGNELLETAGLRLQTLELATLRLDLGVDRPDGPGALLLRPAQRCKLLLLPRLDCREAPALGRDPARKPVADPAGMLNIVAELAPGTRFAITLGVRNSPSDPRPLTEISFRPRFDLALAIARKGGGLALSRTPIAVDVTPLRVRGMGSAYANTSVMLGDTEWDFDGQEIFKRAVHGMVQASQAVMQKCGVTPDDIDLVVPHQANLRIIEAMAKRLDLPMSRVIVTVDKHANTSAASIPLALAEGVHAGRIRSGDLLLLEAMGGGFTWGSALLRW